MLSLINKKFRLNRTTFIIKYYLFKDINTDDLTINKLKEMMLQFMDEETFENTKLAELFEKYLPNYKHSDDWIIAFSVNELKLLIKECKELYETKLDNIK